jgi:integrase
LSKRTAAQAADKLAARPESHRDQGFVFSDANGRPLKLDAPTKALREIADSANLPSDVSLHSLRHSFATWSLANGGDIVAVQRCLGHSVPSTTLNLYSHVVAGGREKAVAAASNTLRRAQSTIGRGEDVAAPRGFFAPSAPKLRWSEPSDRRCGETPAIEAF